MARIDSVRIAEIFRTLSSNSKINKTPVGTHSDEKTILQKGLEKERDIETLKDRLRIRIRGLGAESGEIQTQEVSLVAIQEIIHWEFGDSILDHPDFKRISESIAQSIQRSPDLSKQMEKVLGLLFS